MKTLTEFDGFALARGLNTKKELIAAGKTAEEIPQAIGEAFKFEGDKLTYFLHALEVAEARPEKLKRVLVLSVEEGKTAPSGTVAKGDKHFMAEFFYTPAPAQKKDRSDGRPDQKGKRGRGKGKRGGGGSGDRNRERGRGGPHQKDAQKTGAPKDKSPPNKTPSVKPVSTT